MTAMTCALVERLQTIPDPRRPGENLKHPLVDLIVLGFCGVLAGCEDCVESADWGTVNEACFRTFLEVPHGIPSHDTFNRVFALLTPTTLQEVVRASGPPQSLTPPRPARGRRAGPQDPDSIPVLVVHAF